MTDTTWLALRVRATPRDVERLSSLLMDLGSTGISEDHPQLRFDGDGPLLTGDPDEAEPSPPPPTSGRVELSAWFPGERDPQALLAAFHGGLGEPAEARVDRVADEDWNASWMAHYEPVQVSSRLWVAPSWRPLPTTGPGQRVLQLDPGQAFGTGTHPTTTGCLQLLDALPQAPRTVLDVGTGTGVLALGALLLGADQAVGVDPDPAAVQAARHNADRAGLGDRFEVRGGLLDDVPGGRFELVFANILARVLIPLAPALAQRLEPDAALIISGLLERQGHDVLQAFAAAGLRLERRWEQGGWLALLLR